MNKSVCLPLPPSGLLPQTLRTALRTGAALLLALTVCASSSATMMQLTATFSGTPVNSNFPGEVHPFSGTLTWLFDSSLIPETGDFFLEELTPTTITFNSPHAGSRIFNTTNTAFDISFVDSVFEALLLGDLDPNAVTGGTDDFNVLIFPPGGRMGYSLASVPGFGAVDRNITSSVSITPASVPAASSTAWLLAAGLAAIACLRGNRRNPA